MENIVRTYDIPVDTHWLKLVVDYNNDTRERRIFIDDQLFLEIAGKSSFYVEEDYFIPELHNKKITIGFRKVEKEFMCKITIDGKTLKQVRVQSKQKFDFWKVDVYGDGVKALMIYEVGNNMLKCLARSFEIPEAPCSFNFKINDTNFVLKVTPETPQSDKTELTMNGVVIDHFKGRDGE
ncbi:hypothetical protein CAEBREN_03961 [Caenorhabditis brenneri]|uniref:Uncharacterized protein n=1 Tax=Caenorhabditis brenneri TaxID=135651 RepID=G0MWP8_CAEBE|nr:hypothetical protein CAEBREN_03961 [Caenorhabditis brenneri]